VPGFSDDQWTRKYLDLRFRAGNFNDHIEFFAIRDLLPEVKGLDVFDLGCGPGVVCNFLAQNGARRVVGVDVSSPLIKFANRHKKFSTIQYCCEDMVEYLKGSIRFDLVVSSLALHFVSDLPHVLYKVCRALPTGGYFVFSVRHPVRTSNPAGEQGGIGEFAWAQKHYGVPGERTHRWLGQELTIFHRSFEMIFSQATSNGFDLVDLREPVPTSGDVEKYPELKEAFDSPPFLVLALRRNVK
jgi:SAM-dependent methyltransferase